MVLSGTHIGGIHTLATYLTRVLFTHGVRLVGTQKALCTTCLQHDRLLVVSRFLFLPTLPWHALSLSRLRCDDASRWVSSGSGSGSGFGSRHIHYVHIKN